MLSENWLNSRASNVQIQGHSLVSAEGRIQLDTRERVDRNLAINHIAHPKNQAIVRVEMTDARARSMYGKALQMAGRLQTPMLVSDGGDEYMAVGYVRYNPAGTIYLHIDTTSVIRSMKEIDINRLAADEQLYLYFRVAKGTHLNQFKIGSAGTQAINVNVP